MSFPKALKIPFTLFFLGNQGPQTFSVDPALACDASAGTGNVGLSIMRRGSPLPPGMIRFNRKQISSFVVRLNPFVLLVARSLHPLIDGRFPILADNLTGKGTHLSGLRRLAAALVQATSATAKPQLNASLPPLVLQHILQLSPPLPRHPAQSLVVACGCVRELSFRFFPLFFSAFALKLFLAFCRHNFSVTPAAGSPQWACPMGGRA